MNAIFGARVVSIRSRIKRLMIQLNERHVTQRRFTSAPPRFLCFAVLTTALLILPSAHANDSANLTFTPVFISGESGYSCFRIPGFVTTKSGTLLAVADGRRTNCADIPNPLDLVLKRSTNSGRTWGPLQLIADYGANPADTDVYPAYGLTNSVPRVSAGDAALLLDRANGRIWVLYDNGAYVKGRPHNRAMKLELRYSDDDGVTWSRSIDLEAGNPGLRPQGTDFMASPGNGIQIRSGPHAGRLIFCAYVWFKPFYATVIYSDDHGGSWHRGGIAAQGGGEMQIAEANDGKLVATIRNNTLPQKGVRFFNTSNDAGETWNKLDFASSEQPAIPDPKCQASLLAWLRPKNSRNALLALVNASNPDQRTNLTLRFSHDGGVTWPESKLIYPGPAAYSALTVLPNGDLGILAELDKYHRIAFTQLHP